MKKYVVLIVMAVAVIMPSHAQFKFGVQAGVNMTNVSVKDMQGSVKNRSGFFVGPMVKFTLPIVGLGVDAAALYDQREVELEEQTLKAQSIQIPINLRYGFGLGSMAEIFLFAGPQFGFNVGRDKKFKEIYDTATSEWTLRSSNLSANVGVGAMLINHLQVKFNYNFALGKTGEFKVNNITTGDAKYNTWQISLAYLF